MFLFETARCKGALSLKISMNDIKKIIFRNDIKLYTN